MPDLTASLTIRQLKAIAKEHKLPGYSRLNKADLLAALQAHLAAIAPPPPPPPSVEPKEPTPVPIPVITERKPSKLHLAVAATIYAGVQTRKAYEQHRPQIEEAIAWGRLGIASAIDLAVSLTRENCFA